MIKKKSEIKPPIMIRYLTSIHGISLKQCLRIYRDSTKLGSWVVLADDTWKERKVFLPLIDKESEKVIAFACLYNSQVRGFIINNTLGAIDNG